MPVVCVQAGDRPNKRSAHITKQNKNLIRNLSEFVGNQREPQRFDSFEQMAAQMAFAPEILIKTPNGVVIIIEAKLAMNDISSTEEALKR